MCFSLIEKEAQSLRISISEAQVDAYVEEVKKQNQICLQNERKLNNFRSCFPGHT